METWKEYRIKDLGEVITGNTPPTSNREYYGSEYKFIKPTDMVEGQRFVPVTEEYYSELAYQKYKRCLLPPKTPCVVTIGSLGKKMCLTDTECFTNQAVNAVIPNKNNDGEFLYYAFKASVLAYVKQLDSGTTSGRENVSKSSFSNIKVKVPLLPTQQKIASILSAYDNLIQNYKKQIEDLQTTASELYKEWFVRFRFPGYKTTQFENGIPVGWKVEKLGNLYDSMSGGTPSREHEEYYQNGIYPWIKTGELKDCPILETEELITEDAVKHSSAKLFKKDSLIIAMYGATIGQLGINKMDATCNQACCVLRPKENKSFGIYYLFHFFKENRDFIIGLGNGAAQQNLSQVLINKLKIVNPSKELLEVFEKRQNLFFEKIYKLQQQITNLTQQRDLLLPRLMSGKLEVL